MEDLRRIKTLAEKAAREAGGYALEHIGKLKEISRKTGINDLVTDVDKMSEKIIIDRIHNEFPQHSILAEESGEHASDGIFRWIIDPLDGTTNYAHGFPVFCVSIGVAEGGSVKIGVVYDPSRDELFTAEEGKGAFLGGKRIKVSETGTVANSLIATGFAYDVAGKIDNIESFKTMLKNAQAVRRAGSAAIDLCYVACGRFDGFWELGLNPWDTAAGQLIVKEAGGVVTKLNGEPFEIYQKKILATNGRIHNEMRKLLE
ncbi:MAG: inositol monophosphatase family protein [Candidatus Omnitrophota bacterium]